MQTRDLTTCSCTDIKECFLIDVTPGNSETKTKLKRDDAVHYDADGTYNIECYDSYDGLVHTEFFFGPITATGEKMDGTRDNERAFFKECGEKTVRVASTCGDGSRGRLLTACDEHAFPLKAKCEEKECPKIPIKKCELKKCVVTIEPENKERGVKKIENAEDSSFHFGTYTAYGKNEEMSWESDDFHCDKKKCYVNVCHYDGDQKKGREDGPGWHGRTAPSDSDDIEHALNSKEYGKYFYGSFGNDPECKEHKFQCKNKNLTPIGIDLDRSGEVETIRGEFIIDLTGDHWVETLDEWFSPTEGILIDTSFGLENGINGQHLFGDMGGTYLDGFEKLALHDKNGDGKISGAELEGLAIWMDANSNAELDDDELSTLESHDIVSLTTKEEHAVSFVTLSDGSTLKMEDLYFSEEELETVV